MNHAARFFILISSALFLFTTTSYSQSAQDKELHNNWQIQSSAKATQSGEEISSSNYHPQNWYTTTVPHTVLATLVAHGVYKNIFYGRNLTKIPDSLFTVPWWYRTTFTLPEVASNQTTRLRFNGINYRADIWINGHQVGAKDTLEGSFRRFTIDVSKYVKAGANVLALEISRPEKGDLAIGFVDWNPEPADKDMGIWRDVHVLISGPVALDLPFVKTDVDTATLDHADITISAVAHNYADKKVSGTLDGMIGNNIHFSQPVTLNAGESKEIIFTPGQYHQLSMDHPKLWWTHEWGKPNLYNLHLQFQSDKKISDKKDMHFGIRSVSGYMTKDGFRGYRLNGKKILIKGGGWTDPMLLNATPEYEEAGIDYAVHMNLNTIRMEGFWGTNQHIYNLCDEKGILIMAGFSCQWEWGHYFGTKDDKYSSIITPEQIMVAAKSWKDQVTWLRNHPSIFLWLYGSDKWPRPELERDYLNILAKYDTTRPYVQSAAEHVSEITGSTGMKMRGPYDYVPPSYWYTDTANGGAFGFNTETSPGPEVPVLESLKKMIPADSLWPISSGWLYHAARGQFHNLRYYNRAMDKRLGAPDGLTDYLRKAQFLNYEGMRAMFEAFESNRFKATGIIQWMYNASWPKLWWQLYDYYLMPTAAFYGARKANEPVHLSYNYKDNSVEILNNTLKNIHHLSADIKLLNFDLSPAMTKKIPVSDLQERQTLSLINLPDNADLSKTYFLDLQLQNDQHKIISHNFYVLSSQRDVMDTSGRKTTWYVTQQSQYADMKDLQNLPKVKLQITKHFERSGDTTWATVTLKNPSNHLAFMVHLDLIKNKSGASVVPIFWEANYITLLPGEERTVTGYCHTRDLDGQQPDVKIDGWNVE